MLWIVLGLFPKDSRAVGDNRQHDIRANLLISKLLMCVSY